MPAKNDNFFQEIFSSEDGFRCRNSLLKLGRHLLEPVILTGSIAANFYLSRHQSPITGNLNDIDIVVRDLSGFRASVKNDFLIRHFHPHREPGKILVILVDEENRLRIDAFTPQTRNVLDRSTDFRIHGNLYQFISAEDILAKLLSVIYPVVNEETVESKYFDNFQRLFKAVDLKKVKEIWRETRKKNQVLDFEETVSMIRRKVEKNPNLLQPYQSDRDLRRHCLWCVESEVFPLASLSKIYEILGYV